MIRIYKLKYIDKETAITDLISKGVYIETDNGLEYGTGIHSVVELGLISLVEGDWKRRATPSWQCNDQGKCKWCYLHPPLNSYQHF